MPRQTQHQGPRWALRVTTILLAMTMAAVSFQTAFALIMGGEGNSPLPDPGWPKGAAEIINNPARIAYWVGPPFGGGQWHAEYRGDAEVFNAVLADFAKLDVKTKQVIVHDGIGNSFWLNTNHEPAKRAAAEWTGSSWSGSRPVGTASASRRPISTLPEARDADKRPSGSDRRLHRRQSALVRRDRPEGSRTDRRTIGGARFHAGRRNRARRQGRRSCHTAARRRADAIATYRTEGQRQHYTVVTEALADAQGRWVLKKAPAG